HLVDARLSRDDRVHADSLPGLPGGDAAAHPGQALQAHPGPSSRRRGDVRPVLPRFLPRGPQGQGCGMSRHLNLVDASVPTDWLDCFVGHQVWSRGSWAVLLDVWIEAGPDQNCWLSRRRAVRDAKGTRVEECAQIAYVQAVPKDEC